MKVPTFPRCPAISSPSRTSPDGAGLLSRKIAVGALLLAGAQLLTRSLDLILIAVLARLLTPSDFGLVALASGVLIVINSLSDLPVADVLVQRRQIDQSDLATAFTLAAGRGLLVGLFLAAIALPVAALCGDQQLVGVLLVLAMVPVLQGLQSPAMVNFTRKIDYRPATFLQITARLSTFLVALAVAFSTGSYWALVLGPVAAAVASSGLSYVVAPWLPRVRLGGTRNILSFAGWVTLSRMIFTLNQYSDRFFVGGILGQASLGRYTVGSDIASVATYSLAGPLTNVLFAGFSRISDDMERMRSAYLRGQQAMAAAILPLGIGLAVLAEPVVQVVLTPDWQDSVVVVAMLAPVIALQTIVIGVQSAAMALGQPRLLALREMLSLIIRLPVTIWAAWQFGLAGAAGARGAMGLVMIMVNLQIGRKLLRIGIVTQIANSARSLISAAVMVAVLLILQSEMAEWSAAGRLLLCVPLGALTYAASHLILWRVASYPVGIETQSMGYLRHLMRRQPR